MDDLLLERALQEEVDEARARHLRLFQVGRGRQRGHQLCRDLAWRPLQRLGELQSNVARVIAVLGLLRPLEHNGWCWRCRGDRTNSLLNQRG